jgi:hypothetical protein
MWDAAPFVAMWYRSCDQSKPTMGVNGVDRLMGWLTAFLFSFCQKEKRGENPFDFHCQKEQRLLRNVYLLPTKISLGDQFSTNPNA